MAYPESYWNYRLIEHDNGDPHNGPIRAIHEVHYRNGDPVMYTENPAVVSWDIIDAGENAGAEILDKMREALSKPVLRESDFTGSEGPAD